MTADLNREQKRTLKKMGAVDEQGNPAVYMAYDSDVMELKQKFLHTEELLEGLDGVDVAAADGGSSSSSRAAEAAAAAEAVAVPDFRVVTDDEEISLIGEGLPIIDGVSDV